MNENLLIVFAEGFVFIGNYGKGILSKSVKVITTLLTLREGMTTIDAIMPIGELNIDIKDYPHAFLDTKSSLYAQYVELTTGIKVPRSNISQ